MFIPVTMFITSAVTNHAEYLKYDDVYWLSSMWNNIIGATLFGLIALVILIMYIYMFISLEKGD